ncbi:MAG: class I SAM-dependent RNA methyltransferase [Clostridia bacterium]|nr:class I SAM-dependent RNA methyltransferase [Clostridia bacterium]
MRLSIPVAAGLESVVKKQLYSLGYGKAPAENGRILVEGDWEDVARLNVFLRSGERVLMVLSEFEAATFDELYDGFYAIEWERFLETDSRILMDGKSVSSKLAAIKSAGGVAKKAIIRRLADKKSRGRQTFSENGARTVVGFSIFKDRVTVTIDTSGEGLHKRGYRSLAYTAPIKETLAAALIDLSFYNPEANLEKPFADLFCGSGTIPIEAAMRALRIAPGVNRDFDFAHWKFVPQGALKRAKEEARDNERRGETPKIFASDISKEAISIAKYHAKRAGVNGAIEFAVRDMRDFSSVLTHGVLISNPPYGERLSDEREVAALTRDLGRTFFALPDWSAYVLTPFKEFERRFGKSADRKKRLFNANIECCLYTYFGKKPEIDQ